MTDRPMEQILAALQERAKELNCLYRVDEVLNRPGIERDDALREVLAMIPAGWQYPQACQARLLLEGRVYQPVDWQETPWNLKAAIQFEGQCIGELTVSYTRSFPPADEGPFLKEERRLINAIVERIGYSIMQRALRRAVTNWKTAVEGQTAAGAKWDVIVGFLRGADRALLLRVTRRMINHLCIHGVADADRLLRKIAPESEPALTAEENRPLGRISLNDVATLTDETFAIAARELGEEEIVTRLQAWIKEERAYFLYEALEDLDTTLPEISHAIDRYCAQAITHAEAPVALRTGLHVALLRRFFSDRLEYLRHAKNFVEVEDFHDLGRHVICPARSHGKLGGKSAGLFAASNVVRKSPEYESTLAPIKVPRTWYLTSDTLLHFIRYNKLEDVYHRKYREIEQIRLEYPHLVQVFKNSPFPPDIIQGLSLALDDFERRPIIVRSSSLLEDQSGSAFSGKYKSLFLANQGPKRQCLTALQDAIAEIYASVFAPDPIEYRAARGLLDVHEEMGVMIQEVVGTRVGRYFLPAFSGVAFSRNEFRWSARIDRHDGLVRLVPGLGTRAVDRVADDYPILVAPGQPGLRVNVTPDEVARYSPKQVDLINLETNAFETVELQRLLREVGREIPLIRQSVSKVERDRISRPLGLVPDFARDEYAITFEGLFSETSFLTRMRTLLGLLEQRLGTAVDIEFASDGASLYLLQCRPQSHGDESASAAIPRDVPPEQLLFTAHRHVSNGRVGQITHVVYVDPEAYEQLSDREQMKAVGRAVGRLNGLLPKRQFVLIGPGRWGSRGDIRLGVSVSYADISNTAMLIEVARAHGGAVPDASFGTHFFQDLVEARIRYLPLFPDDGRSVFNESFLRQAANALPNLIPEFAGLAPVVRVVDVPRETGGRILRVLLNADEDKAVALFVEPGVPDAHDTPRERAPIEPALAEHWRWRLTMAEAIAARLDGVRFGVKGLYVFGSTKNATAGPGSDIDLLVHFAGDERQRVELLTWLDGWSLALAVLNRLRTGERSEGLLDVHVVTDDDIARQTSYAVKIGAVTDAARPLTLGGTARRD